MGVEADEEMVADTRQPCCCCCPGPPREYLRMELPPPAELELVVAVLDCRDGARRLGGAVVRIMGMVSPWELRREKRMGCWVGCLGRRQVQQ